MTLSYVGTCRNMSIGRSMGKIGTTLYLAIPQSSAIAVYRSYNFGSSWELESTVSVNYVFDSSFGAACGGEKVHVAYKTNDYKLSYRQYDPKTKTWSSIEIVADREGSDYNNRSINVTCDSDGNPWVAYANGSYIYARHRGAGGWESRETASTSADGGSSMGTDADGDPWVLCGQKILRRKNGSWSEAFPYYMNGPNIAQDANDSLSGRINVCIYAGWTGIWRRAWQDPPYTGSWGTELLWAGDGRGASVIDVNPLQILAAYSSTWGANTRRNVIGKIKEGGSWGAEFLIFESPDTSRQCEFIRAYRFFPGLINLVILVGNNYQPAHVYTYRYGSIAYHGFANRVQAQARIAVFWLQPGVAYGAQVRGINHGVVGGSWSDVLNFTTDSLPGGAGPFDGDYLRLDCSNDPLTGDLDLAGHLVTSVADPIDASDAATKGYVDSHEHSLDDLSDVNAPAPSDGQVLTWDDSASEWQAQDIPDPVPEPPISNFSDTSGTDSDGAAREKINAILGVLRAHGLIET